MAYCPAPASSPAIVRRRMGFPEWEFFTRAESHELWWGGRHRQGAEGVCRRRGVRARGATPQRNIAGVLARAIAAPHGLLWQRDARNSPREASCACACVRVSPILQCTWQTNMPVVPSCAWRKPDGDADHAVFNSRLLLGSPAQPH